MFEVLSELSPVPVAGAVVLELGPGKGTGLMDAAAGIVERYAAADTVEYLDAGAMSARSVDYRLTDGTRLPWPDATFDIVWSNSVLEHVRDPAAVLAEVRRVLRPGGAMVAEIDLVDHLGSRRRVDEVYGCLRYSDRVWDLMASERSSWVNRVRASGWRRLIEAADLEIVGWRPRATDLPLDELRRLPYLAHLDDDDLATRLVHVAAVKAVSAEAASAES